MYRKFLFLVGAAQLIIYTLAYQGPLSHIIYYHEQHHLFRFSRAYFQQQCHSLGLLSYLTDFVIQFFYHPLLGSLVMAAILVAVWALVRFAIKRITGHSDLLNISVVPSLALFLYTMEADHNLTLIVGTLLSLIALCLLLALLPIPNYSLFTIHYSLFTRRWIRIVLMVIPLLAYTAFGYAYFLTHYNHPERIMLMAEQRIKAHDAHGVLQYTSRYMDSGRQNQLIHYFHNLALLQTGQLPYHLLDYPPYMGVKCLYFAWDSNSRESEYGHFIYEQLGYINEAQRWESEAMVVWGEQSSHLLNLVRYNIVNGRPRVAQRFINLLKETLYYRSQAESLESLRDSAHIPGLHNALPPASPTTSPNSQSPTTPNYQLSTINYQLSNPSFTNVFNIGPELEYICQRDTTNQAAFEYLMSYLLLSNDVMRFVRDLPMIHRFNYPQLPTMWQEALCIYRMRATEDEFDALGFTISPEVTSRFNRYMQLASNRDVATLQREFGHTYWYYLNYVSPYGSRVLNLN